MSEQESDPGADKLLPGEAASVSSGHLADATHWVEVYAELLGFKQALMTTLAEQAGSVVSDGQSEVASDRTMFKREADRLSRRLTFWRQEVERLSG